MKIVYCIILYSPPMPKPHETRLGRNGVLELMLIVVLTVVQRLIPPVHLSAN